MDENETLLFWSYNQKLLTRANHEKKHQYIPVEGNSTKYTISTPSKLSRSTKLRKTGNCYT